MNISWGRCEEFSTKINFTVRSLLLPLKKKVRGFIQKFPDWPSGARTANGTVLCHYVQFYSYFVSQSSEFCRHNTLCCFTTSVHCCFLFRYDSVRKLLDTPSYGTSWALQTTFTVPSLRSNQNLIKR
jgi:hypothetical protein